MIRITIEGPVASGKTRIAQSIVEFVSREMLLTCVVHCEADPNCKPAIPEGTDVFINEIQTIGDGR